MKKVIFIGQTGSGKTTLCQRLNEEVIKYRKTQAVEQYANSIDTPGEYLENRNFYHALIMSAIDAKIIALIADPTSEYRAIPPAFAGIFSKKVIGIVTKVNQAEPKNVQRARQELSKAGISLIFEVDTLEDIGIEELASYLEQEGV